jgi:hypothetical protein
MKTIIIQEEVKIPQENRNIILEKGDRIKVLKDSVVEGESFISSDGRYKISFSNYGDEASLIDPMRNRVIASFDLLEPII